MHRNFCEKELPSTLMNSFGLRATQDDLFSATFAPGSLQSSLLFDRIDRVASTLPEDAENIFNPSATYDYLPSTSYVRISHSDAQRGESVASKLRKRFTKSSVAAQSLFFMKQADVTKRKMAKVREAQMQARGAKVDMLRQYRTGNVCLISTLTSD